jgi:two-component system chemotaxis response regulator CheB
MTAKKIKVLVVEDSITSQVLLQGILTSDPEIEVVGIAEDGRAALKLMANIRPDVVTMDLHMPGMDGLEATRRIMETKPVPIIIVTSKESHENKIEAFNYMSIGAVAALEKPENFEDPGYEESCRQLILTVKLMSEIKVVRRLSQTYPKGERELENLSQEQESIKLIAMGASTGGPPVLRTILSKISKDFPVPIVIVQHIAKGFLPSLVEWLNGESRLPVEIARAGESLRPGRVYLAPDRFDMGVLRSLAVTLSAPSALNVPSVSCLFRSVSANFGSGAIGVLLTGMGTDGSLELALMKENGAVTIAQDKDSCVVFGMPGEAVKLRGATYILPAEQIAQKIEQVVSVRARRAGKVKE